MNSDFEVPGYKYNRERTFGFYVLTWSDDTIVLKLASPDFKITPKVKKEYLYISEIIQRDMAYFCHICPELEIYRPVLESGELKLYFSKRYKDYETY